MDTVRRKLVLIAGEFIKSARYLEIRLMDYLLREVEKIKMILCELSISDREDREGPCSVEQLAPRPVL